jgi:hypothetical protein
MLAIEEEPRSLSVRDTWADFWPLVQLLLFWKGKTLKKVDETLPLNELVTLLMETELDLLAGLRGVTSDIVDRIGESNPGPPVE